MAKQKIQFGMKAFFWVIFLAALPMAAMQQAIAATKSGGSVVRLMIAASLICGCGVGVFGMVAGRPVRSLFVGLMVPLAIYLVIWLACIHALGPTIWLAGATFFLAYFVFALRKPPA